MAVSVETLALAKKYTDEHSGGGGTGGTTNYNQLTNKPKINGVTVEGEKNFEDYGFPDLAESVSAAQAAQQGAETAKGQAETFATQAQQSATAAQGHASTAQSAATAAQSSAEAAAASAEEANGVIPPTDTAKVGDVVTYDGEKAVWETPSGGFERAWKTIIDETSPEGGVFGFSADGLDGVTEFFIYAYFPQAESSVPFCVAVNDTRILQDNGNTMSTTRAQYSVYRFIYDGETWVSYRGTGINGPDITFFSSSIVARWPQATGDAANKISVTCNSSGQVFAQDAKIKVRGR